MLSLFSRLSNPAFWATVAGVLGLLGLSGAVPDLLQQSGDTIAGLFAAILAFLAAVGVKVQRLTLQNRMLAEGFTPTDIKRAFGA
jgi:hypothetical protein